MDIAMRICTKCKRSLQLAEFIKVARYRSGYGSICKECSNQYCREWKARNSARLGERRRNAYAEWSGPIQRAKESARKAEHPLRVRAQLLRQGMVERSRTRGISFDAESFTVPFLMEWLRRSPFCECCGKALDLTFKMDGMKNDASPSIDRFFPAKGYTQGNIALLCWRCNNLKRDASAHELRTIADWMEAFGNVPG
jgi:hypothetical protein